MNSEQPGNLPNKKKSGLAGRLFWLAVFLILIVVTVYVITRNKDFSFKNFLETIQNANPFFLIGAFLCMIGFVVFEALALRRLEIFFKSPKSLPKNIIYSSADIYFSAITPSASGGQPASAVFMIKDGIPAATTTLCLILNLSLYMISIVLIGLVCLIVRPSLLANFTAVSKVLIYAGMVVQTLLVAVIILMAVKHQWILKIGDFFLRFLHKIRLLKNLESKRQSLVNLTNEYRQCVAVIKGHWKVLISTFLFNLFQRISNISVAVFVFLAVGGDPGKTLDALLTSCLVVVGANAVPVPGAVGVSDALFIDGFSELIPDAFSLELLSRSISFYICIFVCGAITLYATIRNAFRMKKETPPEDTDETDETNETK